MRCFTTSHGFMQPSLTMVAVAPTCREAGRPRRQRWVPCVAAAAHPSACQPSCPPRSLCPAHPRLRWPAGGAPPHCRHTDPLLPRTQQSRGRVRACREGGGHRHADAQGSTAPHDSSAQPVHSIQRRLTRRPAPWPSLRGTALPRPPAAAQREAPTPRSSAAAGTVGRAGWAGQGRRTQCTPRRSSITAWHHAQATPAARGAPAPACVS